MGIRVFAFPEIWVTGQTAEKKEEKKEEKQAHTHARTHARTHKMYMALV